MNKSDAWVKELSWIDARPLIAKAEPRLVEVIDQLNLTNKHTFIRARYPFGAKILHDGVLHLPDERGRVYAIDNHQIHPELRNKLDYRFVPIGLITNKSVEVYFESEDRIMPSKLYTTGGIFGLWQLLDPAPSNVVKKIWHLSAGARSIFMLAMISDNVAHTRLKRDCSITSYAPKTLLDHRKLFVDIVQHSNQGDEWFCEVLFFTKQWAEDCEDSMKLLKLYWLSEAWKQSYNCRNQMSYDVAQEAFSKAISRRNLKPKPYILNTVKHLMSIAEGVFPGFVPAGNSEVAAPIGLIQEAYLNAYLLKYAPIIMHPYTLTKDSEYSSVYYSLSFPTLLDFAPKSRTSPCIMADIRELKMLMQFVEDYFDSKNVNYEFFHSEEDRFDEIKNSATMPEHDKKLIIYSEENSKRNFPHNSPFLRGCVRISLIR